MHCLLWLEGSNVSNVSVICWTDWAVLITNKCNTQTNPTFFSEQDLIGVYPTCVLCAGSRKKKQLGCIVWFMCRNQQTEHTHLKLLWFDFLLSHHSYMYLHARVSVHACRYMLTDNACVCNFSLVAMLFTFRSCTTHCRYQIQRVTYQKCCVALRDSWVTCFWEQCCSRTESDNWHSARNVCAKEWRHVLLCGD